MEENENIAESEKGEVFDSKNTALEEHNTIYEKIIDELTAILPEKWEKVCLYSHVREENYEFFFYVKLDGKFIQYIELEKLCGISKEEIRGVFDKLYDILLPDFMENAWNVLTYIVTNDGIYNVEYDYEDFDDIISYRKAWKEKYLN